jgi:hypothetical protein
MNVNFDTSRMTPADHAALMDAVRRLEQIGPAMRLSRLVGQKMTAAARLAPARAGKLINSAAMAAMRVALRAAIASLAGKPVQDRNRSHKMMAAASGALGGALGLASLPFELPVTTTVMLRAIADIARAEGEDLADPEAAMACLEVFALDGRETGAAVSESGYFAVRGLLSRSVSEAARYIASKGIIDETAPVMLRLISQIASRFGMVVSQKFLAQATPAIGAFGGAAVNLAFIDHFQSLAKGHFTVRRLERIYGQPFVRDEYQRIAAAKYPDKVEPPAA